MPNVVDRMTPVYYDPINIRFDLRAGLKIESLMDIMNAAGVRVCQDTPTPTLLPEEIPVLQAIYARWKSEYEAATGLIEWTGS